MLETPPQRTLALVVGIDHYEYGEDWRLHGPAADALRCVEWLIDRGVPKENIALFLSTESWKDAGVMQWVANRQWPQERAATRDDIVRFVDKELLTRAPDAEALFMFWGGHGVIDDYDRSNYLYTEDAAEGRPYCISAPDLMGALHGSRFEHFAEQVLVVDACANKFSDTGEAARPAVGNFARTSVNNDIRQVQMFAASPGNLASNDTQRETGRFADALFRALKAGEVPGWPDFEQAFDDSLSDVDASELLRTQQPFMVMEWPGKARRRAGRVPVRSRTVEELLKLVNKVSPAPALLYRLYLRSLPDASRSIGHVAIEKWLRDLEDKRPREDNFPSPLVEFGERLAREAKSAEIASWVDTATRDNASARQALRSALDAEAQGQRPRATLFIEVDAQTQAELRWWIHAPDPAHCSALQSVAVDLSLRSDVATRLGAITAEAERVVGHRYDLMVGMIVPEKLLLAELESLKVAFEEDGLPGKPTPLNRRYPVILHWHRRARAGQDAAGKPINAWRQAVTALAPRFEAGGGADVIWLEAPDDEETDASAIAAAKLLRAGGTGICVGLGHPAAGEGGLPPEDIQGCLREGVPCFFWLAKPPDGAQDVRKLLCDVFSKQAAREAPLSIGKLLRLAKGSDPLSSVRIVWDEPGHLPSLQSFQNPSTGGQT
ncbi:caspase family protein [Piscinibacter terrae]|uniref:Caspase family protein n=1 Tax=Piscinibacter terrae TaxID=2496871 RepID=A0A3N7JLM9_9BURK|nr:caspase family protein [Albitalea terrae]RQP22189.1 hypothetical protein DZC73_24630 [Albitalea terrae]